MPTAIINKKLFLKLVGKSFSDEILKDRIAMLGTSVESISKDEIVIEVTPNRPDFLSEEGLARAYSSFVKISTGLKEVKVLKSNEKVIIEDSVKDVRPFTSCAIVKNLELNDEMIKSIIQIQEKLHVTYGRNRKKCAIGIYPLEKIKTPIYYKAMEPKKIKFKPLGSSEEMNGEEILKNHPTGKEFAHLLESEKKYPVFIDSNNNILSMPPLINSEETGRVNAKTKSVFIECSGFDYKVVSTALAMVVYALSEIGGKVYSMELNYGKEKKISPNLESTNIKLDLDYINKKLGLELKEKECVDLLLRMGYGFSKGKVLVPAYRADILHQIDLVEDIAIAYGYENFKSEIPNVATTGNEANIETFKNKISDILANYGLLEVNTYNLTSKKNQIERMNSKKEVVELANALNEEYNVLRSELIPSFLEVLKDNKHNEYPQEIFGTGKVFLNDQRSETNVIEKTRLCCMLTGNKINFTAIKQIFEGLFQSIDIKYDIEAKEINSFIVGRSAQIKVNGEVIGQIGEIHPDVLNNFLLENPVSCFEIDLNHLLELSKK